MRALAEQGHSVRLPAHVSRRLSAARRAQGSLYQALEREPTAGELARELGLPDEQLPEMLSIVNTATSLDDPVGDEDDGVLGDFIPDEAQDLPEEAAKPALALSVAEALATLSPREQLVVRGRFGFEPDGDRTLVELREQLGITRERVRQIDLVALRRLRAQAQTAELRELLNWRRPQQ